jgi:hypothetical protein
MSYGCHNVKRKKKHYCFFAASPSFVGLLVFQTHSIAADRAES